MSEEARAQELFNKQKAYFAFDATKSYEWRIDQLDRLIRMLKDNYERFSNASCKDFKTATQENVSLRAISQAGLYPANCRILDDTMIATLPSAAPVLERLLRTP